jgi:hypothetical protein
MSDVQFGTGALMTGGAALRFVGSAVGSEVLEGLGLGASTLGNGLAKPLMAYDAYKDITSGDTSRQLTGGATAIGIVQPEFGFLAIYLKVVPPIAAEQATEVVGHATQSDWSEIVGGPMNFSW